MATTREKISAAQKDLNIRMANNLKWLIKWKKKSISKLCDELEIDKQISIDRTGLSHFLNDPDKHELKLPFIVACADYFKIPVDAILSKNIVEYKFRKEDAEHQDLLDLSQIMEYQAMQIPKREEYKSKFIDDVDSYYFENYYEEYYCYYYSTVSDENKGDDPIITGKMKMYPVGNKCWIELSVDTKTFSETGEKNYKRYAGPVVFSTATLAMHATLREENIGEYCYIIFRHSHANFYKLDCRMALVLSTASTPDRRYPIVHRMFMSHEQIKTEDMKLVTPHLRMNSSKIMISEKALLDMKDLSLGYTALVDELLEAETEIMYVFSEKDILSVASRNIGDDADLFLTEVRNASISHRYNKVSTGVDMTLRESLHAAGYYHQGNKE